MKNFFWVILVLLLVFKLAASQENNDYHWWSRDTSSKRTGTFYANIGSITKYITSTKTESRVLYLTPERNQAIMRVRSDGQWLPSLERTIPLTYPYSGSKILKIWLISDIHATYNKESEINFVEAIKDIDRIENLDYVFAAGDLVSGATAERFDLYRALKSTSKVPSSRWYELAGNHELTIKGRDTASSENFKNRLGYASLNYTLTIDNMFFIFLGDEGGLIEGKLIPAQLAWLSYQLSTNQDKNIVVLSHYPVYNTTFGSNSPSVSLTPINDIQGLIDSYRIDMWFHGHIHADVNPQMAVFRSPKFWSKILGTSFLLDFTR